MTYDPTRALKMANAQKLRRRAETGSRNSFGCASDDDLTALNGSAGGSVDGLSTGSGSVRNSLGSVTSDEDVTSPGVPRQRGSGRYSGSFDVAMARMCASVAGDINALSNADLTDIQRTDEDEVSQKTEPANL
jgi:hypothetical protein